LITTLSATILNPNNKHTMIKTIQPQLPKPIKSSTGGTITYTKTGLIHTQK